ncbi:MAG: hypothetical protein LBV08_03075 [Clostridiales bacterium]|nr:hypothetical protein [Clostridiales bacterium]
MKKLAFMLALVFLMLATPIYAEGIAVYLNGEELVFDVPPQNINGRVMVPFRAIGEALGAECYWVEEDNTVIMKKQDGMVGLIIGHNKMYLSDGETVTGNIELDVAPQIINSRTLVPVRAVSEGFDCTVTWDGDTKSVSITTSGYIPPAPIPEPEDTAPEEKLPENTAPENKAPEGSAVTNITDFAKALQKNLESRNTEFTIVASGLSAELLERVNSTALPNAVYLFEYKYNSYDGYVEVHYNIEYLMADGVISAFKSKDTSGLNSQQLEVYNKANSIIQSIIDEKMGDYERELEIHDYLALNVEYDFENYLLGDVPDESHTPYGALIKNVAVCDGFAESFRILATMAGLECETILGFAGEPHAWNRVKIDGEYYLLDVTFDTPVPSKPGLVLYAYFNLTDSQMGIDHEPDIVDDIKCTATEYNYYIYNDLLFSSQDEFDHKFTEKYLEGEKYITLKSDGFNLEEIDPNYIFLLTGKDEVMYYVMPDHGVITIEIQ